IFRQVQKPTYDDQARAQVNTAIGQGHDPDDALTGLLHGGDTWTVV
ncbi:MAG: 2-oxoacid:ferredoxin oxidoreductase subunit beta, partial [Nocardioides sp.]|nr:2-oxoacid:ferredoxin oxidoreductase subunit beta [Nocardioides sp.]MDP3967549.1 2-oxoacid:ferredoxin oxidoreductase subunit beta [Nocardioides sp.]